MMHPTSGTEALCLEGPGGGTESKVLNEVFFFFFVVPCFCFYCSKSHGYSSGLMICCFVKWFYCWFE